MKLLRPMVILGGLLLVWQAVVVATGAPPYMLPDPLSVGRAWVERFDVILEHAALTAAEILVGLTLGTLLGSASALTMTYFRRARRWLLPVLVVSQAIPVFALAPLLVLWLGYGMASKVAMATLDGGRIGIAAQALGVAQRCLDLSVQYANERRTFGKLISKHQAIQWKIADMKTRIEAARLLTWKAAALKGSGSRASAECSMAKLYASEVANFCAYEAVQIFGGYGYSREYEVERLYRDASITTLYEGTSEIQRLVIAKSVLG